MNESGETKKLSYFLAHAQTKVSLASQVANCKLSNWQLFSTKQLILDVGELTLDVGETTSVVGELVVGELTRWRNDRYSLKSLPV